MHAESITLVAFQKKSSSLISRYPIAHQSLFPHLDVVRWYHSFEFWRLLQEDENNKAVAENKALDCQLLIISLLTTQLWITRCFIFFSACTFIYKNTRVVAHAPSPSKAQQKYYCYVETNGFWIVSNAH